MKMMMFLLVSALALLVCPAVANPANPAHHKPDYNLNHIIDLAKQYNKSIAKVRPHLVSTTVLLLVNLFLQQYNNCFSDVCFRDSLWRMCLIWLKAVADVR